MTRITPPPHRSIDAVLRAWAHETPAAPAVLGPGRAPLTYAALHTQVVAVREALARLGVGLGDRVALILPDGPDLAVAILAVATGATAIPLNPAYRTHELDRYLAALRPARLIVAGDADPAVRATAGAQGIGLVELTPGAAAGDFALTGAPAGSPRPPAAATAEDVALVLVTSGTTDRPKLVPLAHATVSAAARDMATALRLTAKDRLLGIMPLFHSHGLVSTLLAALVAGGSVICAPRFSTPGFFDWLRELAPTWYSAVPTMHQTILEHARAHPAALAGARLRLIRSSSAGLAPRLLEALERRFDAPVIQAYGTTEASSIACNPLPPGRRPAGSVGVSTGPEVAVVDATGAPVAVGALGEIAVRGPSVARGYDAASGPSDAFTSGWFRTGDQGYLDAEGYLFVTARLTEIVNRGGAKVAPPEVDATLLEHPAVAQAMTVALPHARWGEDVVAAVVLRAGAAATEGELRRFAAARLALFKVPTRVWIVDALAVGPTGKPDRREVAAQLRERRAGAAARGAEDAEAGTPLETLLVGLVADVLGAAAIGVRDNFFERGGDSLLATRLLSRVREATGVELSIARFFEHPTVAELAAVLLQERLGGMEADAVARLLPGPGGRRGYLSNG